MFLTEKFSKTMILIGVILLLVAPILFVWRIQIDLTQPIDSEKIGQFGDLIGGLVGSIWAFAGVILFYVALKDQRKDILTNQKALETQIREFSRQSKEMTETRKEHRRQTANMRISAELNALSILVSHYQNEVDFSRNLSKHDNIVKEAQENRDKYVRRIKEILESKSGLNL